MATETTQSSLDELAKGLANGTLSRGKAIRLVGGALLGTALASFPGVAWANDCRRLGRECRRDSQCCSRNCVRRGDDKVCGCPEGKSSCNDRCVNLDRNENHCGSCSNRCVEGQECVGGVCQCLSGTTLCGGQCVSTTCPEGQTFNTDTCQCETTETCTSETVGQRCNGSETCFCGRGFGGSPVCYQENSIGQVACCAPFRVCSSDSDCPSGRVCSATGCCAPACGNIFPEQNTTPLC